MGLRIADTFTDCLPRPTRLTGDEQKSVKTTVFDLQLNPAHPSMNLHKIEQSKDKNFRSVRVSSDSHPRLHKTAASFVKCHRGQHGKTFWLQAAQCGPKRKDMPWH